MIPVVPYQFEPTSDNYEEEHLVWEDAPAVRWCRGP
jgi:hypothetical protein